MSVVATSSSVKPSVTGNIGARLTTYKSWRDQLQATLKQYHAWLEQHEDADPADGELLNRLSATLDSDRLVLALVGEFSRGKTELLNALFFSDFDQRLLPSSAGRTTMCPTELRHDEKEGAYIRLLPIETRKTTTTVAEYRQNVIHWHTHHILRPNSPEDLRQAFHEVTRTKRVHVREAQELGLYDPNSKDPGQPEIKNDTVEIPMWRHAVINYPHPLLRQGLVVLDTPGLNALGAEPELTLSTLPGADAVLFLLAADTGVTHSDMEIWRNHVNQSVSTRGHEHIVVLNKIDILWDALSDEASQRRAISQQIGETAQMLGVDRSAVFAVSAKQGLIARIKKDETLLEHSGLRALENKLADEIVPNRYELIRRHVVYELSRRLERSRNGLQSRVQGIEKQAENLKSLGGQNMDDLQRLVANMRQEKERYDKEIAAFQEIRRLLAKKAEALFERMGMAHIDELVAQTRAQMKGSWTTAGLREGMTTFFQGTTAVLDDVKRMAVDIQGALLGICQRLHKEYGLGYVRPTPLSLLNHALEMKKLESRAEAFRDSAVVVVTEQNRVIERFFATLVAEVRRLFEDANEFTRAWFSETGAQIFAEIKAHKLAIEREIDTLRRVHENVDSLTEQLQSLERTRQEMRKELDTLVQLQRQTEPPPH
jgi:hypothetical protein